MHKLKIYQHDVGKRAPFPLLYLFKRSEFDAFRASFETFIGFPVRHHSGVQWDTLRIHEIDGNKNDEGKTLSQLIPGLNDDRAKWQAAVPILTLRAYAKAELPEEKAEDTEKTEDTHTAKPAFLAGKQWGNWKAKPGQEPRPNPAYPRTAYLVTREKVHVPVCNACPRVLLHEAGECHVGDSVCFEHLRHFAANNLFARYIDRYEEKHVVQEGDAGDSAPTDTAEGPAESL